MSRKIPFNSLFALIGFLFSFGLGLIFFAISYQYSLFPVTGVVNQIFLITITYILGIGMVVLGMWILDRLQKKEELKTEKNEKLLKAIAKKLEIDTELVTNEQVGKYKKQGDSLPEDKKTLKELAKIKTQLNKLEKLFLNGERSSVNQVEYSLGFASLLGSLAFVSVKANPWVASIMAVGGLVLMILSPYSNKKQGK